VGWKNAAMGGNVEFMTRKNQGSIILSQCKLYQCWASTCNVGALSAWLNVEHSVLRSKKCESEKEECAECRWFWKAQG
jgi:hypothetical protein